MDTLCRYAVITSCIYMAWAVWVRRWTLRATSDRAKMAERGITTSLILQACGLLLMSPVTENTFGRFLHHLTGQWHIDTWAGHSCYIGAAAAIALNFGSRLDLTTEELRHYFTQFLGRPIIVLIPILLALMVASPHTETYCADFFACPLGPWLCLYWMLLCGYIAFVMVCTIIVLGVLRQRPQNRRVTTAYMVACALGFAVCMTRVVTVGWLHVDFRGYFWLMDSSIGVAFAYATSHSWRQKIRYLDPAELL